MAWIARDLSEDLYVYDSKPIRDDGFYEWIIPDAFRYNIFDLNRVLLMTSLSSILSPPFSTRPSTR